MGLRFRKSFKLGPVRINLSKSGIGYSYGVKGYRVTHKADGGVRTTASIPGTGVSYVTEKSAAKVAAEKAAKAVPHKEAPAVPETKHHHTKFINCPRCGKTTVEGAGKCYHCGKPLGGVVEPRVYSTPARSGGKGKLIAGVLAAVVAVGGVGLALGGEDEAAPAPPPAPEIVAPAVPEVSAEPVEAPEASEPEPVPEPEVSTPAPAPVVEPENVPEPTPVPEPAPAPEPTPAPVETPVPEPEQSAVAEVAYIGNKNSKIFHETWCDSVDRMADKNKVELASRADAIADGFDPCKNCTP